MINAKEANKMGTDVLTKTKATKEYVYAIQQIEKHIADAIARGKNEFCYNICALAEVGNPSSVVLEAVKDEVEKNGYIFERKNVFNRIGNYNDCFEVRW